MPLQLLLAAVTLALYVLAPSGVRPWAFDAVALGSGLVVLAAVGLGRYRRPLPWLLIGLGQVGYAVGDIVLNHFSPTWAGGAASPADPAYLVGYALVGAGLVVFVRRRASPRDIGGFLDACIVTVGAGVMSWLFLVLPLASDTSLSLAARVLAIAYPCADLLILGLLVRLSFTGGPRSPAYALLVAGFSVHLLTDTVYAAQILRDGAAFAPAWLFELGWLAGYMLTVMAALHPAATSLDDRRDLARERMSSRRVIVLACAAIVAPMMLGVAGVLDVSIDSRVVASVSTALFVLVSLRMFVLLTRVQAQSEQLARLAASDELTGLANRRTWDERLPLEVDRAARNGQPLSVAVLDIDNFKGFNDSRGHQAGDELLRQAATAWTDELRSIDLLVRYGGDEFCVLLPNCTEVEAAAILDRLRHAMPEGQTCSIGVARWDGNERPSELVRRADLALYAAKGEGRDRTRVGYPASMARHLAGAARGVAPPKRFFLVVRSMPCT